MKKRLWCLILPAVTLILEILPYGAVTYPYASLAGPEQYIRELRSYFDPHLLDFST